MGLPGTSWQRGFRLKYEFVYRLGDGQPSLSFKGTEQEWQDYMNERGGSFTVIRKLLLKMNVFDLWSHSELAMDVSVEYVGLMRKVLIDSPIGAKCVKVILQAEELARTLKEFDQHGFDKLGEIVSDSIVKIITTGRLNDRL